jgi:very-short-patch-repair endonuclease
MPIEVAIISELEREFPDLHFQRQYRIGKYRVDAVILQESIPVIAIEIDEYQHKRKRSSEYDKLRENYIITAYPDLVILRIDTTAKEFSLATYFNIIQELCK